MLPAALEYSQWEIECKTLAPFPLCSILSSQWHPERGVKLPYSPAHFKENYIFIFQKREPFHTGVPLQSRASRLEL